MLHLGNANDQQNAVEHSACKVIGKDRLLKIRMRYRWREASLRYLIHMRRSMPTNLFLNHLKYPSRVGLGQYEPLRNKRKRDLRTAAADAENPLTDKGLRFMPPGRWRTPKKIIAGQFDNRSNR